MSPEDEAGFRRIIAKCMPGAALHLKGKGFSLPTDQQIEELAEGAFCSITALGTLDELLNRSVRDLAELVVIHIVAAAYRVLGFAPSTQLH